MTDLLREYQAYVDTFRDSSGELEEMLRLKLGHTMAVVDCARRIMSGEGFAKDEFRLGEIAALLHDTGRYAQFKKYRTFRDAVSVDHAAYSAEVVERLRWLDGFPAEDRECVLTAVRCHNRKTLPAGLPPRVERVAHLVRDADKLDIFRVLENAVAGGELESHPEIAWGLPVNAAPSSEVVEAVCAGRPVEYSWIKSLSDFVLIQVGWLYGGLHYRTALEIARERGALEFRRGFMKSLSDSPEVDRVCDLVSDEMDRVLGRNDR
ncbi:MAG: HD domain-containing protein [Kiritimatiellae bacterium]|nr:HD domain-containing protein [Kiritimatiellia bacterium]